MTGSGGRVQKSILRSGVYLGLICILAAAGCNARKALARKRVNNVENGLLRAVYLKGLRPERLTLSERMAFYRVPGVGLSALDGGAVEWSRVYGDADAQTGRALTADTVFQAGALAQLMTAAAVVRLADRGEFGLDEDIRPRLKSWSFPAEARPRVPLTPRALLTHSAGLSEQVFAGYGREDPLPTIPQILAGIVPAKNAPIWHPPRWRPNRKAWWSDADYTLLQQFLEDATGTPFAALLKKEVLDPLGLKKSFFSADVSPDRATSAAGGHTRDGAAVVGRWRRYPEAAAKGLWTTADDYASFLSDLLGAAMGRTIGLLRPDSARALLVPQVENFGAGFLADGRGDEINYHCSAKTAGFASGYVLYPAKGQGIVVLTNSDNGDVLRDEILAACAAAYGWPHYRPVEKDVLRLDPDSYRRFVGRFEVGPQYALDIAWEDYYLVVRPTGQTSTKFYAEGPTLFYSVDPYIRIQFYREANNSINSLVLRQRDFELEAKRVR